MPKTFGAAEHRILGFFEPGSKFYFENKLYTVEITGKPTCRRGEPKTDIFIGASSNSGGFKEFKISFKKHNADFLENKTNAERAEQLFGREWSNIISYATSDEKSRNSFSSSLRTLVCK